MSAQLEHGTGGLLIYRNAVLIVTVLGGVKLEGLDRMRVTLKVETPDSPRPPVRHNLDLYNDNQLGKLVRVIAARLEVGMSVTEACLAELIEALEAWRLEEIKKQSGEEVTIAPLTEDEEGNAVARLRAPGLMAWTQERLSASGLIGEEKNRMILYVAMTSRLLESPISVFCMAKSGVGKSYLQERVAACFPDHTRLENTQFTENSFYYFGRRELSHMIVLIEDMDGAANVLFPIRELQSKKRISKTVTEKDKNGKLKTRTIVVEGPVCVIGSTTQESLYEDNANRSITIQLDDSQEQDARVNAHTRAIDAAKVDDGAQRQAQQELQHIQRVLRPIKVVNPYAELIELPSEVFKPRRTLGLLLGFIKAITFYHQQQREERADEGTGEVFIETSPEDVEAAFDLLSETLFRKSDELSGACRSFYDWLHVWAKANPKKAKGFTGADVRKDLRIHPRMLQRYLGELVSFNQVRITGGGRNRNGYTYTLTGEGADALRQRIDASVAQVIERVRMNALARTQVPAPAKTRKPKRSSEGEQPMEGAAA